MTYKEFRQQALAISKEPFEGSDENLLEYGIQRARFRENQLQRLIVLANQTGFSTAKRKVAGWRRQLERVGQIKMRLKMQKSEPSPIRALIGKPVDRALPTLVTEVRPEPSRMRPQ